MFGNIIAIALLLLFVAVPVYFIWKRTVKKDMGGDHPNRGQRGTGPGDHHDAGGVK